MATSKWRLDLPPDDPTTWSRLRTWSGAGVTDGIAYKYRGFRVAGGHRIVFIAGENPPEIEEVAHHLAKINGGTAKKLA